MPHLSRRSLCYTQSPICLEQGVANEKGIADVAVRGSCSFFRRWAGFWFAYAFVGRNLAAQMHNVAAEKAFKAFKPGDSLAALKADAAKL